MKKEVKKILSLGFSLMMLTLTNSCNQANNSNDSSLTSFESVNYENINTIEDINTYQGEVKKDSKNNDDPVENGVINCPYYTLSVNGKDVNVYSTRCAMSVHSFAWIDVLSSKDIKLDVSLKLKNKHKNVVVLPLSSNVEATINDDEVKATITSLGSFSFAFDKKVNEGLTIYVSLKEELKNENNYSISTFEPNSYTIAQTDFKDTNTVYYFKKGTYTISSINLPSNSTLYFESGCYFKVVGETPKDAYAGIRSTGTENINIYGRAIFDFSANQGGDAKVKGVFNFMNVSNVRFSGITVINSNSWSVCFTNSDNVLVEKVMIFGYRTYSDGIMLSDCQDSIVRNCFVRTGDDAIEAKSTGSEESKNLLYENNAVWTDKARAYGCIYESNKNMDNIVFRNNSVGFALATWTDRLGCLSVAMGTRRTTVWQNIHFEDIEIYMAYHALMNITLADDISNGTDGGTAKNIYFKNINAYRAYGLALRINVLKGSTLGKVYLDNIQYNEKKLEEKDLDNKEEVNVTHYDASWSKKSNIKVDTLTD